MAHEAAAQLSVYGHNLFGKSSLQVLDGLLELRLILYIEKVVSDGFMKLYNTFHCGSVMCNVQI